MLGTQHNMFMTTTAGGSPCRRVSPRTMWTHPLSKNSSSVSLAAVARDSSGCYLGASTLVFAGVSDPETLEVLACREGLALANDLIRRARVASDCLDAVRSIQIGGMSTYNHIIHEIKARVEDFLKIEFVHERR